jgi:hypothetical protein
MLSPDRDDWVSRLQQFVDKHAGTEAALLGLGGVALGGVAALGRRRRRTAPQLP